MNGTFQTWPNRGRYSIRIPVSPILLLFAILGCSGDLSGLVTRDLFGTWSGQAELGAGDSAYLQLRLSHDLDAPTFTGSGTMTIGTFVRPLVVSGNYARQAVTMTMNTSGFDQVIFIGNHDSMNLNGSLNGAGFVNSALNLLRTFD